MKERYTYILDVSLQLAVEDVYNTAKADGMEHMPEMICYNIARHQDPTKLTPEQAERFVRAMKDLLGINHVQKELRP